MQAQRALADPAPSSPNRLAPSAEWGSAQGGPVGELTAELQRRLGAIQPNALIAPRPADGLHRLSVAAGYGGLLATALALAWGSILLF